MPLFRSACHCDSFTAMWVSTEHILSPFYTESSVRKEDVTFLAPALSTLHLINVSLKEKKKKDFARFLTVSPIEHISVVLKEACDLT